MALKSQNKKLEQNYSKVSKNLKVKEEYCEDVREWMAKTIGIERVTNGCEELIMKEISNRLKNYSSGSIESSARESSYQGSFSKHNRF